MLDNEKNERMQDEDESILVNPKRIRERRPEVKAEEEKVKFRKKGNTVEINFESEGRFSVPDTMFFEDYDVEHVQQLATIDIDDVLETMTAILEEIKNKDCPISVGEMTASEFLEALVGIKYKFDTKDIKHFWICECQNDKPEGEQKVNETNIDITTLKYKSIKDADEAFKNRFRDIFKGLSDDEFKAYLKNRYVSAPLENYDTWTREQEVDTIKIKEPIFYRSNRSGNLYGFELMRIRHVVQAQREINKKYRARIKAIANRVNTTNLPLPEFKAEKEDEIKKLEREKTKDLLIYSQAFTLVSLNGQKGINNGEKVKHYLKLKREEYFDLGNYLNDIEYGIYDKRDFTCPLCGKVEGRLLQREINPLELIPVNPDAKGQGGKNGAGRANIYFGV